jgi:hypothetical protein
MKSSTIYTLHQILLGFIYKEDELGGSCSTHGDISNDHNILVRKPRGKGHLEDLNVEEEYLIVFEI